MTTSKKINFSIGIFIILVILVIVFITYPLFTEIKNNSQELISQKKSLAIFKAKIENLEDFKGFYKEFKQDLQKIDNLFIDPKMPIEFISFLERNAEECQTKIKISSTSPKKTKKDPWPFLAFQINSISSFPSLLKFIEKIETSPYLIEIQNLNINQLTGGDSFSWGDVNANLFIKIYTK